MSHHLTEKKFSDFSLHPKLLQVLDTFGFVYTTPIQSLTLEVACAGDDIIGKAQTGTGKTLAFLIPILNQLLIKEHTPKLSPTVVILLPTRELCTQVANEANKLAQAFSYRTVSLIGGESESQQLKKLGLGVDFLVATPGRFIDLLKRNKFNLEQIGYLVLDEADNMMNANFLPDLRYILSKAVSKEQRQTLMFSATINYRVKDLANSFMNQPTLVSADSEETNIDLIEQEIFFPTKEDKIPLLLSLMEEEWPDKSIVFANTKHGCEEVYRNLKADKHRVEIFTSNATQKDRNRIISMFNNGDCDVLVATDLAARGLDIPNLTHVFNYDIPSDPENYVHRIGRTGRAGNKGKAISFICENFALNWENIKELIQIKVKQSNYEPTNLIRTTMEPVAPGPSRKKSFNRSPKI